jgi:hypothetical protein
MAWAGGSDETELFLGTWLERLQHALLAYPRQWSGGTMVTAMKKLRVSLMAEHFGLEVPIKVLLQPCALVLSKLDVGEGADLPILQ